MPDNKYDGFEMLKKAGLISADPQGENPVPTGMLENPSVPVNTTPIANPDDSFSTIETISIEDEGQEVLIPTIHPHGYRMSPEEAFQLYKDTGRHLGKFDKPERATAYAKELSKSQGETIDDTLRQIARAKLKQKGNQ